MGLVRQIVIGTLALSSLVFVALFGRLPAFRNTPIGFLNRTLLVRLPNRIIAFDQKTTNGRLATFLSRSTNYLLYEQNPVVLIFFLALLTSAAALFLSSAWSLLSRFHHVCILILLPQPYVFTYLCAYSTKSYITSHTVERHLKHFYYDYTLFFPNNNCQTCRFEKPARSKHCSICKTCVSRADHHCAWVNNCVGYHNYRWFLLLLLSLFILLSYGMFLAAVVLNPRVPVAESWRGDKGFIGALQRWGYALGRDPPIGGVGLLCGFTAPLAFGMWSYHMYLTWLGATTNETGKWASLRDAVEDGLVWQASRSAVLTDDELYKPDSKRNDRIVLKTRDGRPPILPGREGQRSVVGPGGWRKVHSLDEVENAYDKGFWRNLVDIFKT